MNHYLCVVTGASSDIGCSWMKRLREQTKLEAHWTIIGQYRKPNAELEALANCNTDDFKVLPFLADFEKREERAAFVEYVEGFGTPTHILHLAAKPLQHMRIKDFDYNKVHSEMEVQFFALAELLSAFIGKMSKNKFGRIVALTSSVTLGVPPAYMSNYTAIKYAVLGLMKSAANEYRGKGICVNCISPEMVDTKFLAQLDERIPQMAAAASPLGRHITKEEVAAAIEYLFSTEASCINGINLNLSGGQYM